MDTGIRAARIGIACVALAALVACASTTPSATEAETPRAAKSGTCDASKVQWAIGQVGDRGADVTRAQPALRVDERVGGLCAAAVNAEEHVRPRRSRDGWSRPARRG